MCLSTMQVSAINRWRSHDAAMNGGDRLLLSIRILFSICQEQPLFTWKNREKVLSLTFLPSAVYLPTQVLLTVQRRQLWLWQRMLLSSLQAKVSDVMLFALDLQSHRCFHQMKLQHLIRNSWRHAMSISVEVYQRQRQWTRPMRSFISQVICQKLWQVRPW